MANDAASVPLYSVLKLVSLIVLVLMVVGLGYAGWISVTYWTGIGV